MMVGKNGNNGGRLQSVRVGQHESIHTLNYIVQQSAFASINAHLQNNKFSPSISRKSCQYLQSLARKATLRLDVSIKRSICARCHSFLLPGITCVTKIRQNKSTDLIVVTCCTICGFKRRTPCPAVQSKRFKSHSRKNKKVQKKLELLQLNRKVKKFSKVSISQENPLIVINQDNTTKPLKPSQRERRRAAKMKAEENNGQKFEHIPRKRKRRRKATVLKGTTDFLEDEGQKGIENLEKRKQRRLRKAKKPQSDKQSKAVKFDLPPYSDRIKEQTGSVSAWTDSLPKELTDHQRKALKSLRGDHFITVGLGRGGMVGDVL